MIFKKRVLFLIGIITMLLVSCGKPDYRIGHIVMTDGTIVAPEKLAEYKGSGVPESVIFSLHGGNSEESDRVIGVLLNDMEGEYQFSKGASVEGASANSDYYKTLVLRQQFDSKKGIYVNQGFHGIVDGRYVAYNMSDQDIINEDNFMLQLPAISECRKAGGYLPSAGELYQLFLMKSELEKSYKALSKDFPAEDVYWSSSGDESSMFRHLTVNMGNGYVGSEARTNEHKIVGIKCYSGEKRITQKKYHIGDIVLDDGTVLSKENFSNYKGKAKPMAIIFSMRGGHFESEYRILGMGINVGSPVEVAAENSYGDITNFVLNQLIINSQTFNLEKTVYENTGFTGTYNGKNSWENICKMDAGKKTDSKNYPVYDYAVNYGETNNLSKYKEGWYVPTASETYELFCMKSLVNESLKVCGKPQLPFLAWTSSQSYYDSTNQYIQDFTLGEIQTGFKSNQYPVICVYQFKK